MIIRVMLRGRKGSVSTFPSHFGAIPPLRSSAPSAGNPLYHPLRSRTQRYAEEEEGLIESRPLFLYGLFGQAPALRLTTYLVKWLEPLGHKVTLAQADQAAYRYFQSSAVRMPLRDRLLF